MPLLPGAEPISTVRGPDAVLLLHGFASTPQSMAAWAWELAANDYTVSAPRLPGHGTTVAECNRTGWRDWLAEANRALQELLGRCERVFVAGQGLGGTLALRLAAQRGDEVAGLILVNPAVFAAGPERHLLPLLARLTPVWPGDFNDLRDAEAVHTCYDRIPMRAARSARQLQTLVRADLGRIRQPTLIFTSESDNIVDPASSEYVLEHITSVDRHAETLQRSQHVATLDCDADIIVADSLAFLKRLTH